MVLDPNDPNSRGCGSFFTNPIVEPDVINRLRADTPDVPAYPTQNGRFKLSAGWLIEHAGLKRGTRFGRVGLSPKHALAIINLGGACAKDVVHAASVVRRQVFDQFGVVLVPEPVLVGVALDPM